MTDSGAALQPDQEQATLPFRPRSAYVGHRAFGRGDGAVLVEPEVALDLRAAAEFATQEGRVAGGLLYGQAWGDDLGAYLVVDGFLQAKPGENPGDRPPAGDQDDDYELSDANLRLLRADAARMYSAAVEVGWWRTRASAGVFSRRDFATQAQLAGPGGAGLLVYGSGARWGTAYLGPDGQAPDAVGRLVAATDPAVVLAPRRPAAELEGAYEQAEPEVIDLAAGESLLDDPGDGDDAPPERHEMIDLGAGESLLVDPVDDGELPDDPLPERHEMIDLGAGESLLVDPVDDGELPDDPLPELGEPLEPAEVIDLGAGESLLDDPVDDGELPDDPLPGDPMPGEPLPHHSLPDEPHDEFFEPIGDGPLAGEPADDEPLEEPLDDEPPAGAAGTGTVVATRRATFTPAPQPSGQRVISPVVKPRGEWGVKEPDPGYVGPHTPTDVKIVVALLLIVPVIAAAIIGMLVNSVIVAVVAAVVFLLAVLGCIWMSRL